jgi:hypothetical protein
MIRKAALLCVVSVAGTASAVEVRIDVANLAGPNGVALSPFFVGFHDGSFDAFDEGAAAGTGIEAVAELGSDTGIAAELAAAYPSGVSGLVTATSGGFGPGIFLPGGSGNITLDLDPVAHRYLSYGAMVVPSNDYFVGNGNPNAVELFDAMGNFTGSAVTITADQIWNAGTEVDDPADGPAFVVGQDATTGTSEGGVVSFNDDLSLYSGASTPAGYDFTSLPTGGDAIARISFAVVPEPAGLWLVALAAAAALLIVRRQPTRLETAST